MENLKITVSIKNKNYGQALAKGLARLSPGIILQFSTDENNIGERIKSGEIIITDIEARDGFLEDCP